MESIKKFLALFLCCTLLAYAQGNTFNKVRYNGGSVSTTVKPDDWDNKLTITADAITLALKDGKTLTIPPKQVTSLSYGQEAHRRVGTAIGLAMISLGVGVLFLLHKTKLHFIGINYTDMNGKKEGVLIQGDKSNFRAIIVALQGVTGVPVSVSEKERGEIPAGISVQSVKEPEEPKQAAEPTPAPAGTATPPAASSAPAATTAAPTQEASASISISSNPDAADIYVDDAFSGNAPATLKLSPGKHTIRVSLVGYKPWSREITVQAGSEAHLVATLERLD
jgi:hypothetical protein